jgi:cytochrome c biogenesis protein CcmG/thiol:disulfide interchange protein DsbE
MRNVSLALVALAVLFVLPHSATARTVGEDAPEFSAPLLEGGDFNLKDHIGKKAILLDWWSINCAPCVQAIPSLIDLHERYSDDLLVVGMNVDSFVKRVRRFVKTQKFKISYPTVLDKRLNVMKRYKSTIVPTTVIIDKKGKIIYSHVGYEKGDEVEFEEKVQLAISAE